MVTAAIIVVTITSMATIINDFHSHCLPEMDDGARDVKMSCGMLKMAAEQGVEQVMATPHFYWGHDTVESFLRDRARSYAQLQPHLDGLPKVRLGAEVLLREHISSIDLRPLCLEGTDILLVELPFMPPTGWLVEELENIAFNHKVTVMLAHLDRYMPWYSASKLEPLLELPDVIVQLNAESIADRRYFRMLRKWLPECPRLVLGSDMHNLTDRAPQMAEAVRLLQKKRLGREWLERIEQTTDRLL